jgi:hypothetical protein
MKILFIILITTTIESWSFCKDYIDNEWPDYRYKVHNDETVTDTRTKLMWKLCSEGQSGVDCLSGVAAEYDWEQALGIPVNINNNGFAGYTDWRIPNLEELRSLVAYNCSPAYNVNIFPNVPFRSIYWSSSPYKLFEDGSRAIGLGSGSDGSLDRTRTDRMYVRLVRTI